MRHVSPQPAGARLESWNLRVQLGAGWNPGFPYAASAKPKGELKAAHPLCFRHQVILHPPLGPVPGQLILCYLLEVEDGDLGRCPTDAAARGPLKIFYRTRLWLHLWLLWRLQERQSQEGEENRRALQPRMGMLGFGLCFHTCFVPLHRSMGARGAPASLSPAAAIDCVPPCSHVCKCLQ